MFPHAVTSLVRPVRLHVSIETVINTTRCADGEEGEEEEELEAEALVVSLS